MKKLFMLLTIGICMHGCAQQIDHSLLAGTWSVYALTVSGFTFHKDSIRQELPVFYAAMVKQNGGMNFTPRDSALVIDGLDAEIQAGFKMELTYTTNGEMTSTNYAPDENGKEKAYKSSGTYSWEGDYTIYQEVDKTSTAYTVNSLSKDRLTLIYTEWDEEAATESRAEMVFKRK